MVLIKQKELSALSGYIKTADADCYLDILFFACSTYFKSENHIIDIAMILVHHITSIFYMMIVSLQISRD